MDNASETRYSLGLFSFSSGVVDIPKELGDETQPLKYKPFDHFGFLHFNQSEEGKKSASSIKAYCGIWEIFLAEECSFDDSAVVTIRVQDNCSV